VSQNLVFIGGTPYPNGLASTNRLVGLLSELPQYGWNVQVICFGSTKYPTSSEDGNSQYRRRGIHKGVNYYYSSMVVRASRFYLMSVISGLWGVFILPAFVLKYRIQKGKFMVTTNLTQGHYVLLFKIICMLCSSKFVLIIKLFRTVSYSIRSFLKSPIMGCFF